jgi:hypothetical protein
VVTTVDDVAPDATDGAPRRRARPGRKVAPGPVARFEPGRVAEPRHRNPVWLLAGILLVVLSALAGVLLFAAGHERTEALVAAHDLAQGDVVDRDDLRIERIAVDGGLELLEPSAVDELIGQRVVGAVPGGTLLHPDMFAAETPLGPGEMDIGAALDPGEFPQSAMPIGSLVELLASVPADPMPANGPAGEPVVTGPAKAASIGTGTITAVEERATGQLLVTLRVSRDVGLVAAQAARDDTLRVALVGAER